MNSHHRFGETVDIIPGTTHHLPDLFLTSDGVAMLMDEVKYSLNHQCIYLVVIYGRGVISFVLSRFVQVGLNPFSTVTYCFTNDSEIEIKILLILVRVCEGYKIEKDILHPFIPHTHF